MRMAGKLMLAEGFEKRMAQRRLWEEDSWDTEVRAELSQGSASVWCKWVQNQSMPATEGWAERNLAEVGSAEEEERMAAVKEAVGASEMEAEGKRWRRVALAIGEGSMRRRGLEWREGFDAWMAAGKVPKQQLTEIQAGLECKLMRVVDSE